MQYFQAYRFVFESPKWLMNILIGIVCGLVPILGPIVLVGYLYDVIEKKHRLRREGYPEFDFNRLGPYFMRGVWPFLVQLVVVVPAALVFGLFFGFIVLMAIPRDGGGGPSALPVVLILIGIPVLLILSILLQMVIMPMSLRAGLSQDFGSAFSMAFVLDFLGKVWGEMLLSMLFLLVTAPFLILAGLLACCIGIYPAQVMLIFAQYHFQYQLYELYLERGGTPIPLKQEEPSTGHP